MRLRTSMENGELHVVHPPTVGAVLVGSVFLLFGVVCLVLIAIDTAKKFEAQGLSAITHAAVSVLIVSAMSGIPGLLFGFHTKRLRFSRDNNEIVSTSDFVVWRFQKRMVADEYRQVRIRRRTETSRSKVGNSNSYQTTTRYYCDIVLAAAGGRIDMIESLPEADEDEARQTAKEIADYLQIHYDDTV
ncbi:MAG: hypothetical protein KDA66_08800 [Planctomycetaceae bacterium]|nr:hypothetical protein [Planctomycetaceae bacterium]